MTETEIQLSIWKNREGSILVATEQKLSWRHYSHLDELLSGLYRFFQKYPGYKLVDCGEDNKRKYYLFRRGGGA